MNEPLSRYSSLDHNKTRNLLAQQPRKSKTHTYTHTHTHKHTHTNTHTHTHTHTYAHTQYCSKQFLSGCFYACIFHEK